MSCVRFGSSQQLCRLMSNPSHPVFYARCAACNSAFSRPELSDHQYGTVLLSTTDGKHHALLSGLDEFPKRISRFVGLDLWQVLARLADPLNGLNLVVDRPCPACGSTELESWSGVKTGLTDVGLVTFERARRLTEQQLRERIDSELTW